MATPLVSIILPTYNGNMYWLSEAINSVLSQTYSNFELIIINDASTNNIERTILEYVKRYKKIRYYKNDKNFQLTKTLNRGIELCQGQYIARIDDDDIWFDTDKLKQQVEFMENNLQYGVVGTGINTIDGSGNIINFVSIKSNDKNIREYILSLCPLAHSSVLIRKTALDVVGSYNIIWNTAEDYELWLRIGRRYLMKNLPKHMVSYRIHLYSISRKNILKQQLLSFRIFWLYKNYYPNIIRALFFRLVYILYILLLYPVVDSILMLRIRGKGSKNSTR